MTSKSAVIKCPQGLLGLMFFLLMIHCTILWSKMPTGTIKHFVKKSVDVQNHKNWSRLTRESVFWMKWAHVYCLCFLFKFLYISLIVGLHHLPQALMGGCMKFCSVLGLNDLIKIKTSALLQFAIMLFNLKSSLLNCSGGSIHTS